MRYIKENRNFYANFTTFDTLKLRFPEIPMNKLAHFVVCYIKHLVPTSYIGFRPLKPAFQCKITFFVIFRLI